MYRACRNNARYLIGPCTTVATVLHRFAGTEVVTMRACRHPTCVHHVPTVRWAHQSQWTCPCRSVVLARLAQRTGPSMRDASPVPPCAPPPAPPPSPPPPGPSSPALHTPPHPDLHTHAGSWSAGLPPFSLQAMIGVVRNARLRQSHTNTCCPREDVT